ncbi:MAG TPA: hypothetical protein VIU41_09675, partial [Geobacteraceae bacterium]
IGATLEWRDLPVIASSANKGMGVLEGLFRIVKMAMQDLRANVLTQEESAVRDGQMGQAQNITSSSVYHAAVASVSVSERTSSPPDFAIATEPPDISAAIAEVAVSMAGQPIARTGGEVVIPITVDVGETHLDLELVLTIAVNREKVGSV